MSGRLKKSRATALLGTEAEFDDLSLGDRRRDAARVLHAQDETTLNAIHEVFAGTPLLADRGKVELLLFTASEVRDQWSRARDSFLTIGRKLLALEETLTADEFVRLRRDSVRIFPFSDSIASQLRQVARAVRSGRIPAEQCPTGYSTAYLLAVLSEDELARARAENLVRPDVPRARVVEFRKRLAQATETIPNRLSLAKFRAERDRLDRERTMLLARLKEIGVRRREIVCKLAEAETDEPR
ncbi:MAG TPA: hypothetical protein VMI52_05240 [Acetobacteraceae bacterium]|nr:hypothetical protein [Acetobacteraceae bacterium]